MPEGRNRPSIFIISHMIGVFQPDYRKKSRDTACPGFFFAENILRRKTEGEPTGWGFLPAGNEKVYMKRISFS